MVPYIIIKEQGNNLNGEYQDSHTPIVFFDLDNTLYPEETGIHMIMAERIVSYLKNVVEIHDNPTELAQWYYKNYGLAIRGLIEHHKIDPVDYDRIVDGGLPLENILSSDPKLRHLLESLSVKKWVFTNAGKNHAIRVLNILEVQDQFDGIIYCDYSQKGFMCKPDPEIFIEVMKLTGAKKPDLCYLIDDSSSNIIAAKTHGWNTVHIVNDLEKGVGHFNIKRIYDLPSVITELWQFIL
jgi:pyrimidine and pyridine-specific 5'-nucleotidase